MSYKRPQKIKKIKTSQSQTVGVKMPLSVVHLIWNHPVQKWHITVNKCARYNSLVEDVYKA
jgi:hypothetical protein